MEEAKKNNIYFIVKYEDGDWYYMEALKKEYGKYVEGIVEDSKEQLVFNCSNSKHLQFGITNIKYDEPIEGIKQDNVNNTYIANETYISGENNIIVKTDSIENTYYWEPSPNIIGAYPYLGTKLKPGVKTTIRITYNDTLKLNENGEKPNIYVESNAWTSSSEVNSKLENFKYDKNTIWFDFTPSSMWGDNSVIYYFKVKGLVGEKSNLAPRASYYYVQETFGCSYSMLQANKWRVYARPTLIDTGDIDLTGWKLDDKVITAEEAATLNQVTDKMALVVTPTNTTQENQMSNLIKSTKDKPEVLGMECYNINLVLCNKNVLKAATGDKMTVYLGFPEGYGPESAGVTFKAYHFSKNSAGTITSVDELKCVVTPYGLLVTCDAFSPFAVVAVKKTNEISTDKSIVATSGENGKVINKASNKAGIETIKQGESKTYIITSNANYQIESLKVGGKEFTSEIGKENTEITVNYNDIEDESLIIEANFVAKNIVQREEENGEKVVEQIASEPIITIPETKVGYVDQTVVIEPSIQKTEGVLTYQWYKDGNILEGKTNPNLTIDNATKLDSGNYSIQVTNTVGSNNVKVLSSNCILTIENPTLKQIDEITNIKLEVDEGIIPNNTKLNVQEITSGAKYELVKNSLTGISKFKAFDINLQLLSNNIQPDGKVKISIPIPEDFNVTKLVVYRIEDDGQKIEYSIEIKINQGIKYAVFETEHFSTYVLAEKEDGNSKNEEEITNNNEKDNTPKTGYNKWFNLYFLSK